MDVSKEDLINAQAAMDISCLNGIIAILVRLNSRGIFDKSDLNDIHNMMSKPLNLPQNASNDLVQMQQERLDELFAEMSRSR